MTAAEILNHIGKLRVLVLGDICLDRWCWYDPSVSVPSAETGIPRIGVIRTEVTPGAGGTVANNLVALGVEDVTVLGVAGADGSGWELRRSLAARKVSPDLMITSHELCTFTYTKLINSYTGAEDLPRLDLINTTPLPTGAEKQVMESLESHWPIFDVIVVSDQAETETGGVITPAVRSRVNELAEADASKVVWVDSRRRSELFRHVIVKPNRREAEEACARIFGITDFQRLASECQMKALFVTHGSRGVAIYQSGSEHWAGTRAVQAVDICGAGDSFSAGAACALAVTGDVMQAGRFGNLVASITVTKKGTGTASREEILQAEREMPTA